MMMWSQAMPILQGGKLEELVDPCLGFSFVESQLERMALAAFLCIRRSPHSRPRMELVRIHCPSHYLSFVNLNPVPSMYSLI